MYDVIIIGAGPAGLTAAVYTARKKLSTLLVCKDIGGQVNWTSTVENYMGYQFIQGAELIQKFEEQVKQFPIDLKTGQIVTQVYIVDKGFEILTESSDKYQGKTMIIASGKRPKSLNVPGESKFVGRGVTYCSICDGPLFADMDVAVIGGGNSALEAVDDMAKISGKVYMISLTQLTGDQVLIDKVQAARNVEILVEHEVLEITGDKFVSGLRVRNLQNKEEKSIQVSGVLIEIGLIPNSSLAKNIAAINRIGEIEVNCSTETSVPGLFAAGDVANVPEKQIVVAAGEGAKAALAAHKYLQRYQ